MSKIEGAAATPSGSGIAAAEAADDECEGDADEGEGDADGGEHGGDGGAVADDEYEVLKLRGGL